MTAHQNNALNVLPTAKNSGTDKISPSASQHDSIVLACHQGQVRDGCILPLARNLRTDLTGSLLFLQLEDGLLTEQNQDATSGHVVSPLQHTDWIEHPIVVVLMGTEKVVVGDPERHVIVGAIVIVVTATDPVSGFKRAVKPFDHLLVGRNSLETASLFVSPITWVMSNWKLSPNSLRTAGRPEDKHYSRRQ